MGPCRHARKVRAVDRSDFRLELGRGGLQRRHLVVQHV